MAWYEWVSLLAVAFATAAVVLSVRAHRAVSRHGGAGHGTPTGTAAGHESVTSAPAKPLVAFIANPAKPGAGDFRERALRACAARYFPEPIWLQTTAEEPGVSQAREAVARGAQVVVAIGGDGTVRAVAEGLTGTDVPMGLVPQGTGNLLARNLDLPIGDVEAQLRVALDGSDRRIDVGWLEVTGAEAGSGARHLFLVIAGIGFDAAMVADTDEDLKARVGWIAYFVAGVRHLHARRMRVDARLDESQWFSLRLRSLLIGNCGRLPGGITLLPAAQLDDGWLDVGAIDTRGGMLGWTQLFGRVVAQGFGVKGELPGTMGKIQHARAQRVTVRCREPQRVQVDGDLVEAAVELVATVDADALTVRVP